MSLCYGRVPWRLSPNFFVWITLSVLMLLSLLGLIPNQTIGFYCNDPKISHKFTGDTISMALLLAITILLPLLVIWTVEWMYYSADSYKSLEGGSSSSIDASSSTASSSSRSRQFWKWYGHYTIGWYYLIFVVEALKMVVGEPRPHFLDSCRPREMYNCTDNSYKQSYTCTNTQLSWFYVNDSDKSFPSGHAALAMFTATFLTWYLHNRMPNRLSLILIKPWLQCSAILWGLGCGLSRIIDHRHHWWDVGIGYALGLLFGVFVVRVFCKSFRPRAGGPNNLAATLVTLHAKQQQQQQHHQVDSPDIDDATASKDYANKKNKKINGVGNHHHHQSIKKLLSTSSSIEVPEDDPRELGGPIPVWSNV